MIVVVSSGKGIEYFRIATTVRERMKLDDKKNIVVDRVWVSNANYQKISKADVDKARKADELIVSLSSDSGIATLPGFEKETEGRIL